MKRSVISVRVHGIVNRLLITFSLTIKIYSVGWILWLQITESTSEKFYRIIHLIITFLL